MAKMKTLKRDEEYTLPEKPAVYAYYSVNPDGKKVKCKYVGETLNLSRRDSEHREYSREDENEELRDYLNRHRQVIIVYEIYEDFTEDNKDDLREIQAAWIAEREPEFNKTDS